MNTFKRCIQLFTAAAAGLLLSSCAAPIQVPADARLIWAGEAVGPQIQFFPDGNWPGHGQLYFVDDLTGHVEDVFTVSPGSGKVDIHIQENRRYRAYFEAQPLPPAEEILTPDGHMTSYNIK